MNPVRSTPADALPPAPPIMRPVALLVWLGLLALVGASFASLDFNWAAFGRAESWENMAAFLAGFAPPDLSAARWLKIAQACLETLAMSALGTGLAALMGLVLALPASGRWGWGAQFVSRIYLNGVRAIPELVWASMMLIAAGLGPFAGTLALAAHTSGVLGRLFAETLENQAPECEQALARHGVGASARFFYASLPLALPQFLAYTLYRWENNIRAAAVMGVVGAGGLGQMLKYHLSLFQMQYAASVMIAMLVLVAAVDALSWLGRRQLMR